MLSSNYTLVAWVNIPNFIFANASDAATLQLFDAIGLTGVEVGRGRVHDRRREKEVGCVE